ncbi:hypothetical protein BP6252_00098 [Coleophoma cylindrospora]|uniref:F-box domain-containing protein n=1 Tax=Coleophoma cylindrospora TaxID=1849047 RepID=A0A3D8SP48_9HELO|nr:hypothetical protein BP6252_00098 [Coleophoma cylindrospora]
MARTSQRAAKVPQTYAELSTEDEDEDDFENSEADSDSGEVAPIVLRSSARSRKTTSTAPIATNRLTKRQRSSLVAEHESNDAVSANEGPSKRRKANRSGATKPKTRTATIAKPASARTIATTTPAYFKGSGVIPPWQDLPYQILVQIFEYATYPVCDPRTFHPTQSCRQLLGIARLCRAFAEPAFSVLYRDPPLVPMEKAHKLVGLLNADPESLAFAYRQKVESLRIDVGQVAIYSLTGYGHLDLHRLVRKLPRLVDLEFYHQKDMPPYRSLEQVIKWSIPGSLFDALEESTATSTGEDDSHASKSSVTHLRSWRWSSRLAGKERPIEKLREIHLSAPFITLQKLSFINYQMVDLKKGEEDPEHEKCLANAICALPKLEHLVLESSTLVNSAFLPLLPIGLKNLELINCWEVNSEDFGRFLVSHGSQLQSMTLNHNQSLSLSWLPVLANACPKLEVLRADYNYFNLHATYHDATPIYEILLQPGEVPAWPNSLQILEFTDLRKWEVEACEMFFQSLVDSSASLPYLRRLVVHGGLSNLGWRDRAQFRDTWNNTLRRVFKRRFEPCKPHYTLADGFTKAVESSQDTTPVTTPENTTSGPDLKSTSVVIEDPAQAAETAVDVPEDDKRKQELSPQTPRRPVRQARRQGVKYTEDSSDEEEKEIKQVKITEREAAHQRHMDRELRVLRATAGVLAPQHDSHPSSPPSTPGNNIDEGRQRVHIQGLCEVVDIKIDNQRPTEWQVTEADFLDSEPEGDDDWNGDEGAGPSGYAW